VPWRAQLGKIARPLAAERAKRTKLLAALRWLVPSAVAASGGALIAGISEAYGLELSLGAYAAGFVVLVALPTLFAASVLARGLWRAWQPIELDRPRLAAWTAFVWLATFTLAWAMFQGTWVLAGMTAFKPMSMSFAEPLLAVAAALALVILSRPTVRLFAWLYAKLDRRLTLTPWRIAIGTIVKTLIAGYLIWHWLVKPRVGTLDLSVFVSPLLGIVGLIAVHVAWHRVVRARRIVGAALGGAAVLALALALFAWQLRPNATLTIWGERPLAGLAIDKLFDLDAIRADISLAAYRPIEMPGAPHRDIVLITIDTVRADHTPPYGGKAEMPLLRELAAKGVVFEWAFSPSNVTRRSIPSMVTGLAPNRVRGRVVGWALRIDPRHVLLAERMQAGGYETAGFVCCYGFWGKAFRTGLQRGLQHLEIEPIGIKLASQARAWLLAREKRPNNKPLFLWMHILEPHGWQALGAPRNDDERKRFYDRALTAADVAATQLMTAFADRKPESAPIVIIASDHGEALGEHGQPFHSTDLYNAQIHVPFVIAGPGIKQGRISETVSLTDLTPTILELAGFEPPKGLDGRSLADLATGRRASTENGVAFAAMIKDRSNPGGITAVLRGPWKLISNGSALELYNVHDDPGERVNYAVSQPLVFGELRRLLQQRTSDGVRSPFD